MQETLLARQLEKRELPMGNDVAYVWRRSTIQIARIKKVFQLLFLMLDKNIQQQPFIDSYKKQKEQCSV